MAQTCWVAGLVLGVSLVGVMARVNIPLLPWVALSLLLHVARSAPAGRGTACLWLGLWAAVWVGNRGIIPASGVAYLGIAAFVAASITAPFVADRLLAGRIAGWGSTLIFPMAFAAAEFLRSRFTPAASWGSIAYTQYGCLPVMQVAAWTGIWGITFLIAWFASTINLAWSGGFNPDAVRTPVMIYGAVLVAIVVGGSVRLAWAPCDRPTLRVAALNRPADLFVPGEMTRITEGSVRAGERAGVAGKLERLHEWFLEGSRREARAGARMVAWPEQNLLVFAEDEPAFLARAQRLAVDEGVYLAMGMGTIHLGERWPFENKLVLVDPAGKLVVSYRKAHPVAGWEAGIMRRGDGRLPVIATRDGRMATAICFDADFPEFIRQAGQGEADVLIVAANEWKEIKDLHSQMAAFRAIENGTPLIRPAASGISTAFDPWGRLLGMADDFGPGDRTLVVQVPVGGVRTVYARVGDLFAWLCVACLTFYVLVIVAVGAGRGAAGFLGDAVERQYQLIGK